MKSTRHAFTRFKQLWRSLLLAIACYTDVVVLFLDDVQKANPNSLDLIHTMTKVTRARSILFVCAYRDDATVEKAQEERFRWCFSLKDSRSESLYAGSNSRRRLSTNDLTKLTVPFVDIALKYLNDQATVEFITGIQYGEQQGNGSNRVAELSNVLCQHADGNPFFILHYLDYLSNIGLLSTEDSGVSWEWDLPSIATQTHVRTSIADLLSRIIDRLSNDILQVLMVGAHVDFEFSSALFQQDSLANHITTNGNSSSHTKTSPNADAAVTTDTLQPECVDRHHPNTMALLEAATDEGLLENNGYDTYAFPHDRIQQALYHRLSKHP